MLARLIKYAILAPSPNNSQPWLFRAGADHIDLYADRARTLPVADPRNRQLHIGCGAALLNLRVAVRRFGNAGEVRLLPDPRDRDLLARVETGATVVPTRADRELFEAIPLRRTNRRPFEIRPVSHRIFAELAEAARREGAWLVRLHPDDKIRAAELIARADREQFADREFRRELSRWLIRAGSRRRDGIPCRARGFGGARALTAPLLVRGVDSGDREATRDRELAVGSPLLVVLGTAGDEPFDWVRAGQALQRVLLVAHTHGIAASFLNGAVELPSMRPLLRAIAGRDGCPQLVLRMGYGPDVPAVPRRPVSEVVVPEPAAPDASGVVPLRRPRRPRPLDPRVPEALALGRYRSVL